MKKLFKGCLTTIGALVVVIVGIAIFASGGDEEASSTGNDDSNSGEQEEQEKQVKKAGIGEEAKIANVGFTVTDAKSTGKIESGNEFTEDATTSGKFVILDVKIKNKKKEALTIDSSYFKIKTQDGTTFEPVTSGQVMMAMGSDANDFFMTQINPGLSKSGKVVFEVAKDVKLENTVLQAQTGFFGTESIEINLK